MNEIDEEKKEDIVDLEELENLTDEELEKKIAELSEDNARISSDIEEYNGKIEEYNEKINSKIKSKLLDEVYVIMKENYELYDIFVESRKRLKGTCYEKDYFPNDDKEEHEEIDNKKEREADDEENYEDFYYYDEHEDFEVEEYETTREEDFEYERWIMKEYYTIEELQEKIKQILEENSKYKQEIIDLEKKYKIAQITKKIEENKRLKQEIEEKKKELEEKTEKLEELGEPEDPEG